jgi:hypothetical protein
VDFAIGERIKTIIVPLVNDVLDENPETLQVWLTSAVGPAAIGKNRVATIRIVDNDATPKVSFRGRTSSGAEDQSQFLEVYLSAPSGRPVTVRLVLTGSTAKTPDDFSIAPKEITFAPGETSKFIDLAVVNDTIDERDEVVAVWLTRPVNATLGAVRTHVHTILSDDPLRTIAFDVANVTVSESDGTAVLIVRLSAPSPFPVTVSYAIDGATAVPGKDFVLRRGTLIFKPGETEKRITVRLINDTLDEPTESVQVRLSNAKNATLGLIDILALSIDDDDPV